MAENDCQGEDAIGALVERLQRCARVSTQSPERNPVALPIEQNLYWRAAEAILALSQERDRLREALAPFAEVAERHSDDDPDEWPCDGATLEDARRARAALNKEPPCQET